MAWLFAFLTAVAYFFSVRSNVRLPVGFLWIGFPMRGNKLLRLGLFSLDPRNRGLPKWSFSIYAITPRYIITLMLPIPIQYMDHYGQVIMVGPDMQADPGSMAFEDTQLDDASSGANSQQDTRMAVSSRSVELIPDLVHETSSGLNKMSFRLLL